MFHVMSAEEISTRDERVRVLMTGSHEDQIVGILINPSIGSMGLHEDTARDKAAEILKVRKS